jgi:hypothetical protein
LTRRRLRQRRAGQLARVGAAVLTRRTRPALQAVAAAVGRKAAGLAFRSTGHRRARARLARVGAAGLPEGHDPHCRAPPQSSEVEPQVLPWEAQVVGVHAFAREGLPTAMSAKSASCARDASSSPAHAC